MREVGQSQVRRLLPAAKRQAVGPFLFFDHFGPEELEPFRDNDVRPHPHIGLSTVTYLFEGRSEEHTSELQSRLHLVCRLLLEKKKKQNIENCNRKSTVYSITKSRAASSSSARRHN